jgi:hypothetical protein
MNNMECAIACLTAHREARGWTDQAVAADLLAQLGLDPEGEAKNAVVPHDPTMITEDEVVAHETAAKEAVDKAKAARDKLHAQTEAEAKDKADVAARGSAKEQPAAGEDHGQHPAQRGQPAAAQHQAPGRRG